MKKSDGSLLAKMSMRELAEHITKYHRTSSPGRRFLKGIRPYKNIARSRVVETFNKSNFGRGLSILTMPGISWQFEKDLLQIRERHRCIENGKLKRTHIASIESDEAIYRAALSKIPGIDLGITQITDKCPSYSTCSVMTQLIKRFHCCKFEDLVMTNEPAFDGAWLDFNGQINENRKNAIKKFWENRIRDVLVITFMAARENYGNMELFIESMCPNLTIFHIHPYFDTAPMIQITIQKTMNRR